MAVLAKEDVICHHLAHLAKFRDFRDNNYSTSTAGILNIHMHIMHSLGKFIDPFSLIIKFFFFLIFLVVFQVFY